MPQPNSDPASLQNLQDISTVDAVSWWPPAPGWYFVAGCLVFAGVVWGLREFLWWQGNAYRREALLKLSELEHRAGSSQQRAKALQECSVLLKRVALTVWPREEVASLSGKRWIEFLQRTSTENGFRAKDGQHLLLSCSSPKAVEAISEAECTDLFSASREWIRHHRCEPPGKERKQ